MRAAAAGTAVVLVLSGCGEDEHGGGSDGQLTVSAASSLTDAFESYGEALPGDERFSFAGSDELAAQIRQGATPDLFAAANTSLPQELEDEGLVEEPVVFTRNQLVLAVPAGDSGVASIEDLTEPGLDLVVGAEGVPVGDYTNEVLRRLPAVQRDPILANVRSEESDVKGVVGKLATGAADAGFVYASDVPAASDELRAIELPPELQPVVAYGVAVVTDAQNPQRAREFVRGLLSGRGAAALREQEFLPPTTP